MLIKGLGKETELVIVQVEGGCMKQCLIACLICYAMFNSNEEEMEDPTKGKLVKKIISVL